MQGLAEGLQDPIVSEVLVQGRTWLMLLQWTGSFRQVGYPLDRLSPTLRCWVTLPRILRYNSRIWRNY